MTTTSVPKGLSPQLPSSLLARVCTVLAALLAAAGAAASGLAVGTGSKTAVVLPLAIGTAVLLGVLAMTRFSAYVMLMLVLRSGVDLFKLSGPSNGNTATNTVAAKGLDPSSILEVLFLLAAALWLVAQYREHGRLPGSSLRRYFAIFAATGVVSIAGSGAPLVSTLEALRILAIVMMFAVLEQLMRDRSAMRRILTAAFGSLVFPLVYTLIRMVLGTAPSEVKGSFTRITGPFSQSNTFGRYLMLMIIFGVAVFPYVQRRARWPLGVALALSSIFLVLTYTRTAVLGTAIGLVVVGCVQGRKKLLAILAMAGICALLVVPQLASRFTDLTAAAASPGAPTGNTLAWRIGYWGQVLPLANANPVTGIGLNMTQYHTTAAKQPHNDFIRAYVETGLLGLFAYLAFLVVLVRTGWNAVRGSPRGSTDRAIAAGALGCAICFVAVSAFANVMSNVVSLWYLITFAAAAAVIEQEIKRRRKELEPGTVDAS